MHPSWYNGVCLTLIIPTDCVITMRQVVYRYHPIVGVPASRSSDGKRPGKSIAADRGEK